jgi:AcrR family transcriptional regulator
MDEAPPTSRADLPARGRILDTAYELFSHNSLRAVGVDRIIDESGVAKKTLYYHFASKKDLILAFLDVREQRWTRGWLQAEMQALAATPHDRLLAIFDAFDEWFNSEDYETCAFICTLLEMRGNADPVHQEAVHQLEVIRQIVQDQAEQAGARDPEALAYQMQILMMGAIVSAARGDLAAGQRARELAELLLDGALLAD